MQGLLGKTILLLNGGVEKMQQASEKNRNNGCPGEEKCNPGDFRCETHELNDIKRTVAVLSGKGGVGKSL